MNSLAYIIAFLIFPLNPILALPENGLVRAQEDISIAQVEGKQAAECSVNVGNLIEETKNLTLPVEPIKKEGIQDLVVPTAHASLIMDVESGVIMHYNKGSEKRQIASLTKMMTAILTMEQINNLAEEVTVDQEAVYAEGTRVGCPRTGYCVSPRLKVGEKLTAESLLKAMLMNSANDAAIALSKHIGGTQEAFVDIMNQRAKELGLKDTHFCTASGLEIEGRESECYSTAYDIARIAAYSMKYDRIWEIFRLPNNTRIFSTDGQQYHDLLNTDIVINEIPNCLGGKTGFTPLAGRSLLVAATDPSSKNKVVAVLLDDPYRWQSIKDMVNWAFRSYTWE